MCVVYFFLLWIGGWGFEVVDKGNRYIVRVYGCGERIVKSRDEVGYEFSMMRGNGWCFMVLDFKVIEKKMKGI